MKILCKDDYKSLLSKIKREGNEVNDTYELIGEQVIISLASTSTICEILNIEREFQTQFTSALFNFDEVEIGPYITEKYLFMIPALKKAIKQLSIDCSESRRCVIQFPEEHCFQTIQFLLRENTVNVVCYMRSCDSVKNLPHDIWICSFLADLFARYAYETVGATPYKQHKIIMSFGSLHMFKEDANVL